MPFKADLVDPFRERWRFNDRPLTSNYAVEVRDQGELLTETTDYTSMDGQVPGKTTYRDWTGRQSAAVQNNVLGVTRAKALRRGDVSVADFFDDRGQWLRIADIKGMGE